MFGSVNDEYPMIFKDLNLSRFNTSLVVNMSGMFCECSDLENLNLNNFDTSRVIDMSMMFMNCYRLNALDLRSFDTRNVENMHDMFNGCCSIKDFNISSFRTGKVTDMSGMFGKLRRWLTNDETIDLDLTFFDTSMVINMNAMFMDSNFKTIDLSSFNTSQVTSMLSMFSGCSKLETIYASSNFVTYLVNNSDYMFSGCVNLTGGNGTHLSLYDSHSTYTYDKTHARIDTPEERGYFTEKITNLNV